MNSNISTEKQLQNNVISLLKSMGYIFISGEDNVNYHKAKLSNKASTQFRIWAIAKEPKKLKGKL